MDEVAKLRGLPWACTQEDIMDFFGDSLTIANGRDGIHLIKTSEGRATGEAFVEFENEEDLESSLRKDKKNMGHRYVEVFKVKKSEMEWILKRTRPLALPPFSGGISSRAYGFQGNADTFIRLRGLPYEVTKDDIAHFFGGLDVASNGIQLVVDGSGRSTGEAYVQFTNGEMADEALRRDRQCIGHRYVELFRVSATEMRTIEMLVDRTKRHNSSRHNPYDRPSRSDRRGNARGYGRDSDRDRSYYDDRSYRDEYRGGRGSSSRRQRSSSGQRWGNTSGDYSVLMRGLPYKATESDIHKFFHPIRVAGIHIIYDDSNRPSGTARAYFGNRDDMFKSMGKHKDLMDQRYIELFQD